MSKKERKAAQKAEQIKKCLEKINTAELDLHTKTVIEQVMHDIAELADSI